MASGETRLWPLCSLTENQKPIKKTRASEGLTESCVQRSSLLSLSREEAPVCGEEAAKCFCQFQCHFAFHKVHLCQQLPFVKTNKQTTTTKFPKMMDIVKSQAHRPFLSILPVLQSWSQSCHRTCFVHFALLDLDNQEESLAFYTKKVGAEPRVSLCLLPPCTALARSRDRTQLCPSLGIVGGKYRGRVKQAEL